MATYLVSYDLKAPGRDYDDLIKHLQSYGTYWHHLDSTWLIVTDKSATEIRDAATKVMDSTDRILVVKLTGAGAWRGIPDRGSKWLKDNL